MTKLVLVKKDMRIYEAEDILSFSFVKDAYLPYTKLSAAFLYDFGDTDDIAEAKLIINGKLIHHGCIDTFEIKKSGSIRKAYLTSSGFTSQLCRSNVSICPSKRNFSLPIFNFKTIWHVDNQIIWSQKIFII